MRKYARIVVALAVLSSLALPGTASASAVCLETNELEFAPPLGLNDAPPGAVLKINYVKTCVHDNGQIQSYSADGLQFAYTGNCSLAFVGSGTVIYGGSLAISLNKTGRLFPDSGNPCSFGTGTFQGLKID